MRERPILFSGPMVRAILEGRKTQTRRVVTVPWHKGTRTTPYEPWYVESDGKLLFQDEYGDFHPMEKTGRYQPGDRLWVRETWHKNDAAPGRPGDGSLVYAADDCKGCQPNSGKWRPSIHMPRWASRLTLEVTGVRVERLQDISGPDAVAEGVERVETAPLRWIRYRDYMPEKEAPKCSFSSPRDSFFSLWESINGTESLASNPWVWVVEFRRVEQ